MFEGLFSARALCIAGFIAMPALLFNPIPLLRVVQFLFFWFLCWLSGKKNNPFMTILIILGIVAFNLIVPYGQVLYSIGKFRITIGALMMGIQRAVTLEGLIMLSRVAIRRDLKIPGGFGELIGESFRFFSIIMDSRKRITRKNLIGDIDQLMMELSGDAAQETAQETAAADPLTAAATAPAVKTKPAGFAILAAVIIIAWLPWAPLLMMIVSR